jgi:hypothetical protein
MLGVGKILLALLTFVLLSQGCGGSGQMQAAVENPSTGPTVLSPVTAADRLRAYRRASLIFLNQTPDPTQINLVRTAEGYQNAIDTLVDSPEFVAKMRSYHQEFFKMQGSDRGVNLNEPANLAAYLVQNNGDFRDILRADYCVDDELNQIPCSSFSGSEDLAPEQAAGVVTTQAFLRRWDGGFSFLRASEMLKAFACHDYPDEDDVGMTQAEISESVHTFACTNCNPQCYSCHRTMNARASLFYTFDTQGVFNTSPTNAVAIKRDDGSVSNVSDLLPEGVVPRFRQKQMGSLREYAVELTRIPKFRRCLAKRLTMLSVGADSHEGELPTLLKDVDGLLIKNQFRIKDFFRQLLRSDEYVLQ